MANRFNQYIRTDYTALPVDYYQAALAQKEAETQGKVNDLRTALDFAGNVEAAYNPDIALKEELLGGINSKIAELAKQRLNTPDTLMKLQNIIGDRQVISQLAGIQSNSDYYRAALDKAEEYRQKYGNDINLRRMYDEVNAYNKLGKDGFKAGMLKGYAPDAFVDVVGDVQKVLKDVKADVTDIENVNGQWIVRTKQGGVPLQKLLANAGVQLNDPKYATQLQNLLYYNASTMGGGDTAAGYKNYYQSVLKDTNAALEKSKTKLAMLQANNKGGKYDKDIKSLQDDIAGYSSHLQQMQGMTDKDYYSFYANNFHNDLAMMAAQPYANTDYALSIKANPYALADYNGSIALRNKLKALDYAKKIMEPDPVEAPMFSGATTQYQSTMMKDFTNQFGDLKVDDQGRAVLERADTTPGAHSDVRKAGGGMLASVIYDAIPVKDRDKSTVVYDAGLWAKFADYVNKWGWNIDKNLVKKGDPATLKKLGMLYKNIKSGTNTMGSYGIPLNSTILDPSKVTQYIMGSVAADQNMVTDENGNRVNFYEAFGGGDKETVQQKLFMQLSKNTMPGVINPNTNRIAVTAPDGKTYFITPDAKTSEELKQFSQITNPTTNVSSSVVTMQGRRVPFISVGLMDNHGNRDRHTFVPQSNALSAKDADAQMSEYFGGKINNTSKLPNDGAYLYFKTPEGKTLSLNYNTYLQNKAHYDQKYNFGDPNTKAQIITKTNTGELLFVQPSGVDSKEILQLQMNELLNKGSLRWLLRDTKQANDYIKAVGLGGGIMEESHSWEASDATRVSD